MKSVTVRQMSDLITLFELVDLIIVSEVPLASFLEILAFSMVIRSKAILSSCSLTSRVFCGFIILSLSLSFYWGL